MVSFRDKKDDSSDVVLHVLTGNRQSGGVRPPSFFLFFSRSTVLTGHFSQERALTTVTYLLALAELARAPFALVDEINQGMDQRAERAMHKMLVQTSCKDSVGQCVLLSPFSHFLSSLIFFFAYRYFLLTPKLLPDLMYHPKMKVLVINVSPWLPKQLSLREIVKAKKEGRHYDEKNAIAMVKGKA